VAPGRPSRGVKPMLLLVLLECGNAVSGSSGGQEHGNRNGEGEGRGRGRLMEMGMGVSSRT
jgi:hypothetical protein